ncbi:hypothetical protein [Frigoriglobus tundricola]|uniref:Uncharacterized protein n=1 Tax=Frigoriglobus tundricola TaxID=2774151 RepID=A0A6M5YNB9_9BACT|nr:hypothetical protein [Frigoriglobus tundricola]QJW95418.1 hypothetical protein FTUN_2967 [Frigoriglobus tundricola]
MSGNISDLIRQARSDRPTAAEEAEGEAEEHLCYSKLRGTRAVAFMLELRLAAGDSSGFDYGLLGRCTFDRSAGVTLYFAGGTVTIRGKNLRPVFEGILTHRVAWVAVAVEPATVARDPEATVVTAIEVEVEKR